MYFWVRIFDYKYDSSLSNISGEESNKGTLLDEYYLAGDSLTRDLAKKEVAKRSNIKAFGKPRGNKDAIYALMVESTEFFYRRFTESIDTYCFNPSCHRHITGKAALYPTVASDLLPSMEGKAYCCSHKCLSTVYRSLIKKDGEFQVRENYKHTGVYGYIYHIYNRVTCLHYIGQTVYMPFFRWQEHVKSKLKGDICDLVFETVAEVRVKDKDYLNNVEAYWINKYILEYGRDSVINLVVPNITSQDLINQFNQLSANLSD